MRSNPNLRETVCLSEMDLRIPRRGAYEAFRRSLVTSNFADRQDTWRKPARKWYSISRGFRIFLFLLVALPVLAVVIHTPRDDSDPPYGMSGMSLYTDNLTGCQYLSTWWFGALLPRFDASHNHVGCWRDTLSRQRLKGA